MSRRPIDVAGVNGLEQVLDLGLVEGGGLAFVGDVLGTADGGGGVEDDAVIELLVGEEVAQGGQVLLFAGRGQGVAVLVVEVVLEVVADQEGGDVLEGDVVVAAPMEEAIDGVFVGFAGVGVADAGLEEIGVGILGVGAGFLDDDGSGDLAAEPLEAGSDRPGGKTSPSMRRRHVNNRFLVLVHGTPLLRFGLCRIMSFIRHKGKSALRAGGGDRVFVNECSPIAEHSLRPTSIIKAVAQSSSFGCVSIAARSSSILRVCSISATNSVSDGNAVRYRAASTLFGNPSNAYLATPPPWSAHKISPTGGFSSDRIQCSRA